MSTQSTWINRGKSIMNEDEIRGRNLIEDGRFPSTWKKHWNHFNGKGNPVTNNDPTYGQYLLLNEQAAVAQVVNTVLFSPAQMPNATYKLSFQYENYGNDANAKVAVITSNGVEDSIDLSGKAPAHPQADWSAFTPYAFAVVATDENLRFELHGSEGRESRGLRITDLNVQLHLAPLTLNRLQVDDRTYEV
jgi:hypothetical protein